MPNIREDFEVSLRIKEPNMYKVILHNDDYTSMDFVVDILMKIFHKNLEDAHIIMLNIHEKGKAVCGIYSYEIAQTKAMQVKQLAKQNQFPLLATIEEDN